jgi:S-adenosyl-L-methionine hydrolase (adenosine-forming)
MRPIIALLTDFGTRDSYVAQMKGVILSRCDAEIVDLTHEIAPFDIVEGAFFLGDAHVSFRGESGRLAIVVAVVDPGVGSDRRIIAAEDRGMVFLAPDNGLLSVALGEGASIFAVTNESFFLPGGTTTFHGRDRFAPVAAAVAKGLALNYLGPRIERRTITAIGYVAPSISENEAVGTVIGIDRFGNVVTDVDASALGAWSHSIEIRGREIRRFARCYAEMSDSPEPFAIVGSRSTIEISICEGAAAELLGARRMDRVTIRRVS